MGLWILLALQFAATALGFSYLWRRHLRLSEEVARLREALAALETSRAGARRRPRPADGGAAPQVKDDGGDVVALATETPSQRAARAWRLSNARLRFEAGLLAPDTTQGLALGAAAAAPGLGFLLGMDASLMVAAGIGMAAVMTLLGLHARWSAAPWAGVLTAIAWALAGLMLGSAQASPIPFCVFVSFAGVAGLAYAHLRHAAPGAAMALAMAAAALALASQTAMIGPGGVAFGMIVAAAAITGALSLRLEAIYFAAFGAALVGLFVLSGQDAAAIWFTPATAWAGALFLGVAAVRVPQLGSRGLALAGVGALAALLAVGTLHLAHHGLTDRYAAAGGFAAVSALLAGVTAVSASRRAGGLAALKATLWVLAAGAFVALCAAIMLAAPAPLAATAFAASALALAALNARLPHPAWCAYGSAAALLAALFALGSAQMLLDEAPGWPSWALIALGLVTPFMLFAAAAALAHRANATLTAGLLEAAALSLAVVAANLEVRLFFSGGAMLLQPVGFVETGSHVAVWLLASLLIASRSRFGSGAVRMGLAIVMALMALTVSAFAAGLWLTSYWSARESAAAPITHAPLGFLAPAILFWAHWVFWRARGADTRTRAALASGALMTAAFITLELMRWPDAPEWAGALGGALAFALAIVLNFAPGVTDTDRGHSDREEYLHRHRRR